MQLQGVTIGEVTIQPGDADLARDLLDPICTVYDEVFSAPPFFWRDDESALHRQRLLDLLNDPSFGLTTATTPTHLVGFAYGVTVPTTTRRWAALQPPPPAEVAAEWPGRTFLLFDYALRQPFRGRGVGRALHDLLLASRHEQRAVLTVQPTATATKAIYETWGWRLVGQVEGGPTSAAPVFDSYLRESLDDLRAGSSDDQAATTP